MSPGHYSYPPFAAAHCVLHAGGANATVDGVVHEIEEIVTDLHTAGVRRCVLPSQLWQGPAEFVCHHLPSQVMRQPAHTLSRCCDDAGLGAAGLS